VTLETAATPNGEMAAARTPMPPAILSSAQERRQMRYYYNIVVRVDGTLRADGPPPAGEATRT